MAYVPAKRLAPRAVRRIILRSGIMAVRHLPAGADPCVCVFVASHGMGGTVPSREESGRAVGVPGYGMGGTVPSGDENARAVVTGSGWGAAGLDMCLPFTGGVGCRIAIGHHGVSDSRNTATEKNADAYRRRARRAYRLSQPRHAIASVMGSNDRDDRADAHELLR
jgi:hypothetical protein